MKKFCHDTGHPCFMLPLRADSAPRVRAKLLTPQLERAIGVIYRPETERGSHYFEAVLPEQFDEYIWFDETRAVTNSRPKSSKGFLIHIHSAYKNGCFAEPRAHGEYCRPQITNKNGDPRWLRP